MLSFCDSGQSLKNSDSFIESIYRFEGLLERRRLVSFGFIGREPCAISGEQRLRLSIALEFYRCRHMIRRSWQRGGLTVPTSVKTSLIAKYLNPTYRADALLRYSNTLKFEVLAPDL